VKNLLVSIAVFSSLVLLLSLGGCSNPSEPGTKAPSLLLARASPENVLADLKTIYNNRSNIVYRSRDTGFWVEKYRELFHPDPSVFRFYFEVADAPYCFPNGWWGIEDEVASFDSLFTRWAGDIELSWTMEPSEPDQRVLPDSSRLLHPDWKYIRVTSYLLDLTGGENIYRAMGTADFYFGPDPRNPKLWVITEWWDRTSAGFAKGLDSAGEPLRWGRIKELYRHATCG